tara:strand:- start:517 stop:732 length:216 start_codon:yes stop_codon:yes gene_type:complete
MSPDKEHNKEAHPKRCVPKHPANVHGMVHNPAPCTDIAITINPRNDNRHDDCPGPDGEMYNWGILLQLFEN